MDRLEYSLLLTIIPDDTQKIIALNMRQPNDPPMFIGLFFLLIDRVQMKMQFGPSRKPQIQLTPLNHNLPLPGEIILGRQHDFLIKFDLRRHFNLILIARCNLKMLFLAG